MQLLHLQLRQAATSSLLAGRPGRHEAEGALPLLLQDHQITVHGLPIRPAFSQKLPAKRKLRRQLGMDLDKPAVLLVGESAWLLQGGPPWDCIRADSGCQTIL